MNIVKDLVARIEKRLTETKNPCKLYATEAAAEKVAEKQALTFGQYFARDVEKARPARYVVVHIPSANKWAIGFDQTEIMGRRDFAGGYAGIISTAGFYSF